VWGCGGMCRTSCTILRFHYKIPQIPHTFPYPNPIPARRIHSGGRRAVPLPAVPRALHAARRGAALRPWVRLGCGNGVGFVVKCKGIHIESSDSTTNPSHSTQNPTPKTHPCCDAAAVSALIAAMCDAAHRGECGVGVGTPAPSPHPPHPTPTPMAGLEPVAPRGQC
jgi:hypothetical protein